MWQPSGFPTKNHLFYLSGLVNVHLHFDLLLFGFCHHTYPLFSYQSLSRMEVYRSNHVMKQWDDWVPQDRVRKFTEENKQLATQLNNQMKLLQQAKNKTAAKKGRANGSDFSSARGSEERHVTAQGRGAGGAGRRTRDYDLEVVSTRIPFFIP